MKKALSLLLAVLMLVSLFSGMAYADDDVIVEEPVVEEPVADEAPDAYTDEGNFEAADDAVVEEFTDEGSFEAADIQTYQDFEEWLEPLKAQGWAIERIDPANPVCGTIVKVWVHDGEGIVAAPREVLFDHVWADPYDPENPAVMDDDPTLIKDGVNGWKLISSSQTSCTEGGTLVYKRVCWLNPEHFEIETVTISKGTHVWATDPFTYAYLNGFDRTNTDGSTREIQPYEAGNVDRYDLDATENMPEDLRAIKVMPTKTKAGLGHEVCAICGAENPNTKDYPIAKHVETAGDKKNDFHIYSPWREMVPPTCSAEGWEERVCNIPGCQGSENRQIEKWNHRDPETDADLMVCIGIERVSCVQYVEVWECTNPLCCTEVVKDRDGNYVQKPTYPEASQYVEFRGISDAAGNYATWTDLKAAKAEATATDLYTKFKAAEDDRNASYEEAIRKLKDGEITAASFTDLVKEADNTYDEAIADLNFTVDPFFCYLDTTQKNTNEHYVHHKYESDYEQVIAPDCCVPGVSTRVCSDCDGVGMFTEDPLEPIWSAQHYLTNKASATATDVAPYYYHYVKCIRPGCAAKDLHPDLASSEDFDENDPETYIQDNNMNPQTKIVDHDWGDWIVELPPQGANRGHWYRTCMTKYCNGREDFFGTQEEFDKAHGGEPVIVTGLVWEDEDGEWVCKLYDEDGDFEDDFTGMVEFRGGKFFVVDGYMQKDTNGPTLVGDKWYYLAAGQVQEVTTLAQYGKDWFYVVDGVVDLDKVGLVEYNGGKFVVAAGRVVSEYSGLWFNSKDIGGDDEWYYVANGQVQSDFTGITVYDGEWFYLENGKLIPDYTGEVVYDGVVFEMVNGHLVAA